MNHEHFREICAAASIGEATPEELFAFEQHAEQCAGCQQVYLDYLNLAAEQFAAANTNPHFSTPDDAGLMNSERLTRRFFERAEAEGIRFSPGARQAVNRSSTMARPMLSKQPRRMAALSVAAGLLFGLGLFLGYGGGRRSAERILEAEKASSRHDEAAFEDLRRRVLELTESNEELRVEVDRSSADVAKSNLRMRAVETDLYREAEDRKKLASDHAALEAQLRAAQEGLAQSELLVVNAQKEAANQLDHASTIETALAAEKTKISDLTSELEAKSAEVDRERELLTLGHDVSDLMGARNLHIVDVVDTDPHGKTRPVFGRIFFTEGKSLVFYAYDLNEAKIQKANYQYRVWAKQEGSNKQIRNLGIFYSDDKAQRRWVFKCNDAKILTLIDSVFVTLEPAGADSSLPKGPHLMYAYLWGQPNHP